KLVTQSLAFARALHQPGNIYKFEDSGDDLGGIAHLRQHFQAVIRHGHHAGIRLNRAKTVVRRQRLARLRYGVKQGALPDIGEPHNSSSTHSLLSSRSARFRQGNAKLLSLRLTWPSPAYPPSSSSLPPKTAQSPANRAL